MKNGLYVDINFCIKIKKPLDFVASATVGSTLTENLTPKFSPAGCFKTLLDHFLNDF